MFADVKLTNHAARRMQQRGMRKAILSFVLENADRHLFVGAGCREHWISRKHLNVLRRNGVAPKVVERSTNVAIIVSKDDAVITVFHKTERTRWKKNKQHVPTH